jgi:hypothetical protein
MGVPDTYFNRCSYGDATGDSIPYAITTAELADAVQLAPGFYLLYSSKACRWKNGAAITLGITSSTGVPLPANMFFGPLEVKEGAESWFNMISTDGNGTFEFIPVKD